MATAEEEVTDLLWEEMKIFATEQQQYLYEILSDYTIYESNEHKYLKQNIGYAIYGPPKTKDTSAEKNDCCSKETENLNDANDATDIADYDDKEKEIIDKIYDQICKSTIETDDSQSIYFSTIYNMIIRPKTDMKPKEEEVKKEEKKESKAEIKEEAKNGEKQQFIVTPVPIFKIGKSVQKKNVKATNSAKQENALTAVEILCETLKYVDLSGRAYKTWADYKENNNLPQCTMVLPKDGFYQPDPSYPITEDYSTVWLEIMDSPACTWTAKLCNGMDITSSVVGICSLGLSVASMFTPLAPVVIASAVAGAGVSGAWTIGRSSQQLIDRSNHEESIYLFDNEAFPHYLGIAGTAFGLGAIGGTAIISEVAARGMTVNTFARGVFNTIQGGNLFLNGVGVAYQGYNMINKYITEETISVVDALNLATHLMFFCSSVVKIEFANDIIKNTQGRVINDYRESLSSKRLRKKFNRVKNKAAVNNTSKIFENAEVIRYIKHRQELLPNQPVINSGNQMLDNTSRNIVWSFEGGKLIVNDIKLLDPIEYVTSLISLGIFIDNQNNSTESPRNYANDANADQLLEVLYDLLSKFYASDDCPESMNLPIVPDFERLIREMSSMRIDENCLKMLFEITEKLMKRSKNMKDFLIQTFTFVWQYCKANLKQWGMSLSYCTQSVSGSNILQKIIRAVFEAIDMILNNLFHAFVMYMDSNMDR
ncbi:uncharacterized protein LOC105206615 [Solenopsis invicta]|uniref:uncharacterized protein LOC105206615 n=1 Tax=Solenopsis invicta TaxID=13686 RepID=UPI00193D6894|nr:uncharacterized protein LOC105206615 [Solenopsis invicta]XP_039308309.1 uncharacterized protein LOC105206615 [Solenopsis invicta]XP_039308310.1 uncharacterized protein LOC105206615 [Solenopsis invicta]XP_039308311.1 uncharacterized protein LOC105206615 [Solenopsis invicta]